MQKSSASSNRPESSLKLAGIELESIRCVSFLSFILQAMDQASTTEEGWGRINSDNTLVSSNTPCTIKGAATRISKGARDAKTSYRKRHLKVYNEYIFNKGVTMRNLLLKFKSKDSPYGVTRETLKALADEMDVSETMAVHLAISRFAKEVLPAYEIDDGPLTVGDINRIRKAAEPMLPKGKVINTRSLL